jgi:hypothetical protein
MQARNTVVAGDDRVGDERFAATLQAIEQLAVERFEVAFDRSVAQFRCAESRGT